MTPAGLVGPLHALVVLCIPTHIRRLFAQFRLSIQCIHPHETDRQTKHSGLEYLEKKEAKTQVYFSGVVELF